MIKFLKTHLVGCAREKSSQVSNNLVQFIFNIHLHTQEWALEKEDLKEIIHYKTDNNSLFSKTALNWASANNDRVLALDLLKLENKAHSTEKEGLACLQKNLSRAVMLPWIIESFSKFYQEPCHKRWLVAVCTVLIDLLLLSYTPFMYDVYSDISLTVSYYGFACGNKTFEVSEMIQCPGNPSSTFPAMREQCWFTRRVLIIAVMTHRT
jgi:hypothetical protein